MSTEHLSADERASFLIGQALRRAMLAASSTDEAKAHAWAAYSAALDTMAVEDAQHVTKTTGLIDLSQQWAEHEAELAAWREERSQPAPTRPAKTRRKQP